MSTRGNTPAGKQRVRTGCQTCRKRRRKCDERKPRCIACEVKGFACKYGTDLTFVFQDPSKFTVGLGHEAAAAPAPALRSPANISQQPQPVIRPLPGSNLESVDPDASREKTSIAYVLSRSGAYAVDGGPYPLDLEVSREEQLPPSFWSSVGTPSGARIDIPSRLSTSTSAVSCSSPNSDGSAIPTGSIHETALLCHYRYHTAPWIDISDPRDSFGIAVLTLAKYHRPLLAAILALAARQRLCLNPTPDPYGRDEALARRYRLEAEHGLHSVEPRIQRLGRGLLMLHEFLGVSPGEWRHVLVRHWGEGNTPPPVEALDDELMAPLFWLYLRMDLAAAVLTSLPPLVTYKRYLRSSGALRSCLESRASPEATPQSTLNHALSLLASTLTLVYSPQDPPEAHKPDTPNFPPAPDLLSRSTQWTNIWNATQRWHANRPVEVRALLELRAPPPPSPSQFLPTDRSSGFPTAIHLTPLSLLANSSHHITSFILLSHRPRLLRRCVGSAIFHAQALAGIAANSDSLEGWDPLLITGLVVAGRGMTHEVQQDCVVERLRMAAKLTGVGLDPVVEELKAGWRAGRGEADEWG